MFSNVRFFTQAVSALDLVNNFRNLYNTYGARFLPETITQNINPTSQPNVSTTTVFQNIKESFDVFLSLSKEDQLSYIEQFSIKQKKKDINPTDYSIFHQIIDFIMAYPKDMFSANVTSLFVKVLQELIFSGYSLNVINEQSQTAIDYLAVSYDEKYTHLHEQHSIALNQIFDLFLMNAGQFSIEKIISLSRINKQKLNLIQKKAILAKSVKDFLDRNPSQTIEEFTSYLSTLDDDAKKYALANKYNIYFTNSRDSKKLEYAIKILELIKPYGAREVDITKIINNLEISEIRSDSEMSSYCELVELVKRDFHLIPEMIKTKQEKATLSQIKFTGYTKIIENLISSNNKIELKNVNELVEAITSKDIQDSLALLSSSYLAAIQCDPHFDLETFKLRFTNIKNKVIVDLLIKEIIPNYQKYSYIIDQINENIKSEKVLDQARVIEDYTSQESDTLTKLGGDTGDTNSSE